MNSSINKESEETTKEQNMTLLLLLSYNRMKLYNENFSNIKDYYRLKRQQDNTRHVQ
ncbi:MAG: hypothetical protein K1X86_14435 [Ignavibacteria bacterium]|nr:hypothetical protein [Ignavibacteria bacterium]